MKNFAIIGFGNQAKSWAQNMSDSGQQVTIFVRENGPSFAMAKEMSFETHSIDSEELKKYDYVALLTPDHTHLGILDGLYKNLKQNATIILAHGYSFTYQNLGNAFKKLNFALLAPKAIGSELRNNFVNKESLGAVMSFDGVDKELKEDIQEDIVKFAKNMGITHGPYPVSFEQETVADLISEQSILCSLLPYGAMASFNQLRSMGIPKELAYFECWYEVKLIADTMIKMGPEKFFELISPNALMGSEVAREIFFDKEYFEKLEKLASEVKDKSFTKKIEDSDFNQIKEKVVSFWRNQEINQVHKEIGHDLYK